MTTPDEGHTVTHVSYIGTAPYPGITSYMTSSFSASVARYWPAESLTLFWTHPTPTWSWERGSEGGNGVGIDGVKRNGPDAEGWYSDWANGMTGESRKNLYLEAHKVANPGCPVCQQAPEAGVGKSDYRFS